MYFNTGSINAKNADKYLKNGFVKWKQGDKWYKHNPNPVIENFEDTTTNRNWFSLIVIVILIALILICTYLYRRTKTN